jgi:hypothetical protein
VLAVGFFTVDTVFLKRLYSSRAVRHHRWVMKWMAFSTTPLRLPRRGGHGSTPTP